MTPELKHIIEQISRETQYQKEQIVWGEFVHNIASADSIDAIAKNKRILCAYFGNFAKRTFTDYSLGMLRISKTI